MKHQHAIKLIQEELLLWENVPNKNAQDTLIIEDLKDSLLVLQYHPHLDNNIKP